MDNSTQTVAGSSATKVGNGLSYLEQYGNSIHDKLAENSTIANVPESECPRLLEDEVSDYLWKILPPVLLCFGLVGNILTIVVIRRLKAHKQPTLTFLLFLAINDSVVLVTGLPRYWILYTFDYDLRTASDINCKLYYFFIYTSMQYSSWILVGVTLERVVKTHAPTKYKTFYSAKKVTIGLLCTLFVLCLVNFHFFFTNGINTFTEGDCSSLNRDFYYFDEHVFVYIDFSIVCVVPFIIMFVSNILIVRVLKTAQEQRASMMHMSVLRRANRFSIRMTKMLVVCTFYFLIATAPISLYFILDTYLTPGYTETSNCVALASMDLFWTITFLMQFSNSSINFYLYTSMNDRFYKELKDFICCRSTFRRMGIYSTNRPNNSSRSMASSNSRSHSNGLDLTEGSEENHM